MARVNWSEEETLAAFALYMMLEPKERDDKNPDVMGLAEAIGRSANAVSLKLWNIGAHDERRLALGKKGLGHTSKKDAEVWERFNAEGDSFLDKALAVLVDYVGDNRQGVKTAEVLDLVYQPPEGKAVITYATHRVNQDYFRNTLLDSYSSRCCLTGISIPQLLVASHIKPWAVSDPKTERLDPSNGLLLNALHDRAFDKGLITVKQDRMGDLRVCVSPRVKRGTDAVQMPDSTSGFDAGWLWSFNGTSIELPLHHAPSKAYLEYHQENIFLSA